MDITRVNNNEELKAACQRIGTNRVIAVDTEFKRETTYYPKACLIQLACDGFTTCIDPFEITDFEPLKVILFDPEILKIFHAARQDLELFYFLFNEVPAPIHDTQIAAALLGSTEQIGYAALAKNMLGVELDKSLTRADWEQRPIPEKQIEYAANDVIYLLQIYLLQVQQLAATERQQWLKKDFDFLTNVELYKPNPDAAWKKIKNYNRLKKTQRCIVFKISQWRESIALERNKPRTFIIKNQGILDLANQQPATLHELKNIRELHPSLIRRDGEKLLELIQAAKEAPDNACPTAVKPRMLSSEQSVLLSSLQTIIQLNAKKNKIDSSYLCTKKELEKVILQDESVALLHGWKYELAGKDVVRFINGELRLEVHGGAVQLVEN